MPMMAYEKLDAWKSAHALVLALYEALPPSAVQLLPGAAYAARLHRSALRAVGRIAFGSGTRSRRMFRRAAEQAAGHLSEFAYQLAIAQARGVLPAEVADRLAALRGRASCYTWQLLDTLHPAGGAAGPDR
jgi:four helix bundle protein